MSLLFDENLSRKLVSRLGELFPGARHVMTEKLELVSDTVIWERALADGLAIVSRDSDFMHRVLLSGPPPPVIWLRVGNASTDEVEGILRRDYAAVDRLLRGEMPSGLLILEP